MKEADFTVVGLGVIGGSLAATLRAAGHRVRGFDHDPARAAAARKRGLVDDIATELAAAVRGAGVVILAVPVRTIMQLLPIVDTLTSPSALILDVGSVKEAVVATMAGLPGAARAIGGHPIAGSERSGPEAADSSLLPGRVFVLCPTTQSSTAALCQAQQVVENVDMRPVVMAATEHDRIIARTSHLPQLISSALAASLEPNDAVLAGPGLRDMTRLAGSDPLLWRDIVTLNRVNVQSTLVRFRRQIDELIMACDRREDDVIEEILRQGLAARAELAT